MAGRQIGKGPLYRGRFEMFGAKRPFAPKGKAAAGQRKMPPAYQLTVRDDSGAVEYESGLLIDPVHVPEAVLPPGTYSWTVQAVNANWHL